MSQDPPQNDELNVQSEGVLEQWSEASLCNFSQVAVCIEKTAHGHHVGILHSDIDSGRTELLQLQWNYRLANGDARASIPMVRTHYAKRVQWRLAGKCRQIWRANGRGSIPYGFGPPSDAFDEETSAYLLGPTGKGLTCASFVLAIFHSVRVPLVRYESWPADRSGDREWQRTILKLLRLPSSNASSEHIAAVEKDVGSVRYRPEEVAASASISPPPVSLNDVEALSQRILEELEGLL